MKINLTTQFKDFNGDSVYQDFTIQQMVNVLNAIIASAEKEQKGLGKKLEEQAIKLMDNKTPMTLRNAIYMCSSSRVSDVTASEREQMFAISVACMNRDEVELKPEQQVLIKKFAGMIWASPLMLGVISSLIDGNDPFSTADINTKS